METQIQPPARFRSLRAQAVFRIVLPLTLIIAVFVGVGAFTYNRIVTSLIVERHRRLAGIAAAGLSEVFEGYGRVLETAIGSHKTEDFLSEARSRTLAEIAKPLEIFDLGVFVIDEHGQILGASRPGGFGFLAGRLPDDFFQSVRAARAAAFSSVVQGKQAREAHILIAAPLFDADDRFAGAVVGGIRLQSASIRKHIRNLTIGKDGFTYLVDRLGIVISHPDPEQIGADYSVLPFVARAVAGENGGMLAEKAEGGLLVEAYAPIESAGWGLIIQESWSSAAEPVGLIGGLVIAAGLALILLAAVLSWWGFNRIAAPIQALQDQTDRLARGEAIEPLAESDVAEIDALERAFLRMAAQISAYKVGLRRYVGAVTRSLEDERRRIARDLHDDTAQSLLAVSRRLELLLTTEADAGRRDRLEEILDAVAQTLSGIRRILRDLRPLMLEDLGLIPALQTLVRAARKGEGAVPHAGFETSGEPYPLDPEQELAIYRITQEALTNIRKHARATGLSVALHFEPGSVRVEITDDGRGFDTPEALTDFARLDSFGLLGIQERVWAVGGNLVIQSAPDRGTRLIVSLPAPVGGKAG